MFVCVCECVRTCVVRNSPYITRPRWHESVPAGQTRFGLLKFFSARLACSVCSRFLLHRRKSKVEFSWGNRNTTVALAATSTSWPAHTSTSVFVMELPQQPHQKHVAHLITVNCEWEINMCAFTVLNILNKKIVRGTEFFLLFFFFYLALG